MCSTLIGSELLHNNSLLFRILVLLILWEIASTIHDVDYFVTRSFSYWCFLYSLQLIAFFLIEKTGVLLGIATVCVKIRYSLAKREESLRKSVSKVQLGFGRWQKGNYYVFCVVTKENILLKCIAMGNGNECSFANSLNKVQNIEPLSSCHCQSHASQSNLSLFFFFSFSLCFFFLFWNAN